MAHREVGSMYSFKQIAFLILSLSILAESCGGGRAPAEPPQTIFASAPVRVSFYGYEVVASYPHDTNAFTQGLVYHQGVFYESTGLNGSSSLRRVEIATGAVLRKIDVPSQHFAEGLALFNGRLYQLTWQSQRAFVYAEDSFNLLDTLSYVGEGWGLTHDGSSLIMSDGSDQIRFLDPATFNVLRTIHVDDNGRSIRNLNELEYIKGEIYANIWQTDRLVRIDPRSGRVTAWINLTGLLTPEDRQRPVDVLNGIAYDEAGDRLFVTGKLWPKVYEIRLKLRKNETSR
ncbi:MAG: glutaminyl-peptide cyclotransferase [Blastocatellia bacterium]